MTKLIQETTLVYSTFLGGGGDEIGNGIAVDSDGNAYITGFTASAGATPFPTTAGAFKLQAAVAALTLCGEAE